MTASVSVVLAVYNTAEYLPETLASLERQTIGFEALQVILVDDGSTDGSGEIVDLFAAEHPGNVVVVHQQNSGTPAVPFNRGLERATGRYVFFLGSDDVLDDDVFEVLVDHADRWESDVIFGRLEPLGGHKVAVAVYRAGRQKDMDLYTSRLPWALANTKLFRRELVERLGLRYREDMRQRCDQPFTITAMVNARRISMIGDGAVYHARARSDRSNVTYTAGAEEGYASTEIIMDTIAGCLPPGERRDHVMRRQFDQTIRVDLRDSSTRRDQVERDFVYDRIAELAGRYLTENIRTRMKVTHRAVIDAALARDTETILALFKATEESDDPVPLHVHDGHAYFAYPGFDATGPRRSAYEIFFEKPIKRIIQLFSPARVRNRGSILQIEGTALLSGTPRVVGRLVRADTDRSRTKMADEPPTRGREIPLEIDQGAGTYRLTLDAESLSQRVFRPSIAIEVAGRWYDVPLRFEADPQTLTWGWWHRRSHVVARSDSTGHLVIDRT